MNKSTDTKKNAVITAIMDKGFIRLYADIDNVGLVPLRINDYGGLYKKRARALSYKIYKNVNGGKND